MNTVIFNDGTPILFGNNTLTFFDDGAYRYYKGADEGDGYFGVYRADITTTEFYSEDMVYGIPFKAKIILSKVIPRTSAESPVVMTYARLMLRRMRLFLAKTGPFKVSVTFDDRKDYVIESSVSTVGSLKIGTSQAEDGTYNFPINGKSHLVTVTIETDSSTPFNLIATEWQGQLITKGRNI